MLWLSNSTTKKRSIIFSRLRSIYTNTINLIAPINIAALKFHLFRFSHKTITFCITYIHYHLFFTRYPHTTIQTCNFSTRLIVTVNFCKNHIKCQRRPIVLLCCLAYVSHQTFKTYLKLSHQSLRCFTLGVFCEKASQNWLLSSGSHLNWLAKHKFFIRFFRKNTQSNFVLKLTREYAFKFKANITDSPCICVLHWNLSKKIWHITLYQWFYILLIDNNLILSLVKVENYDCFKYSSTYLHIC